TALSESDVFPACNRLSSRARAVILSGSGQWVTLLRFEWEWGPALDKCAWKMDFSLKAQQKWQFYA
ncbi:hypothetical protein, partial [Serratia sp. N21D137]|uniref:hypothetical protein n=1 Tax=Serratia sp. N21D137 TaxID=3397495 RepID=UPI0039E06B44